MNWKVYIFLGLGVDECIFGNIDFLGIELVYLLWFLLDKKDILESYVCWMVVSIFEKNLWLIGLLFGGMIVVEVVKVFFV